MKKSELRARFQQFTDAFSARNPMINHGGCGLFAAEMGKALKEKGFDAKVRIFTYPEDASDFEGLKPMLKYLGTNANYADDWPISICHALLEVKGKGVHFLFDGEGVYPAKMKTWGRYERVKGTVPLDIMADLADDAEAWNSRFPRRSIPRVKKAIHNFTEALLND